MVDPFDEHGPSETHPEPAPDFFDSPGEPAEVPPVEFDPEAIAPIGEQPAVHDLHGTQYPPPPGPPEDAPGHPIFPVVLGASMLAALAIACFANLESPKTQAPIDNAPLPVVSSPPSPVDGALTEDVKGIKAQIDGLADQVKGLQAKVEGMPKSASAEDLEKLQDKIADLAKADEGFPKTVAALDGRVGALDKSLGQFRNEVGSLKDEVKKIGEAGPSRPSSAPAEPKPEYAANPKPADVNLEDQAVSDGADLFKAGKYKEANDVFRKATEAAPNDARVWYFAALSNGAASNVWTGETLRLVNKGVEREKAGTPEPSKIDQLFTTLDPKMKAWIDYYRKTAKPR